MAAFCSTSRIVTPCRLMVATVSKICSTSTGARPMEGSSSRRRRGRAMSARPIASICCSPPDSVPATWARRSLRRGKSANTRSMSSADAAVGARVGAHLEVLAHGEPVEDAAALGHVGDAAQHDVVRRRCPGARLAVEPHVPGRGASSPEIVRSVVVLPAPLLPSSVDDLALPHAEATRPSGRGSRRSRRGGRGPRAWRASGAGAPRRHRAPRRGTPR